MHLCTSAFFTILFFTGKSLSEFDKDFFDDSSKTKMNIQKPSDDDFFTEDSNLDKNYQSSSSYQCNTENLLYKAYLNRFINILLRSTGLGEIDVNDDSKTVTVDMKLSRRDLDVLKSFGSADVPLEGLETSFMSIFINSGTKDNISQTNFEILKYTLFIASLVAVIVCTIYFILKYHLNKSFLIFTIFIAYFAIVLHDFLYQYEDISDKSILNHMEFKDHSSPPKECFLSNMTYPEKLYFYIFRGNDDVCARFLESRKSMWSKIDVTSAFIKPFYVISLKIFSLLGEGAEKLIKPITDKFPAPFNFVLYAILSVLQLPIIIISLILIYSVYSSGTISLRILFLTFTSRSKHNEKRCLTKQALEDESNIKAHTRIVNHGTIFMLENNDSLENQLASKTQENLNLQLTKIQETILNRLQSNEIAESQEVDQNKKALQSPLQCSETHLAIKGTNTSGETEKNILKNNDSALSCGKPFSLPHFSGNSGNDKAESIFSTHNTLMEEKVKPKKKKTLKCKRPTTYEWRNITMESVRDLCKQHVTK